MASTRASVSFLGSPSLIRSNAEGTVLSELLPIDTILVMRPGEKAERKGQHNQTKPTEYRRCYGKSGRQKSCGYAQEAGRRKAGAQPAQERRAHFLPGMGAEQFQISIKHSSTWPAADVPRRKEINLSH